MFVLLLVFCGSPAYNQIYNYSFDHLTVEDGLSQSTIFAITQDTKGFIWLATRDGLNRYDSHDIKVYRNDPNAPSSLTNNVINALLLDSKGQLWVGTYNGICIYNPETDNFTRIVNIPGKRSSISNNNINAIFEDKDKNIWVGTRDGLNLLVSGDTTKIIRFYHNASNPQSLVDNYVRTLFEDKTGDIWIGTINGISRFKSKRQYEFIISNYTSSITNPNSLSNNWINTIVEGDNETLWIGTEKGGLNIFDEKKNIFYSSRNKSLVPQYQSLFTKIDPQIRVIKKDNNGQYWIGALGGLYVFDPLRRQVYEHLTNPDNPTSLSNNSIRSIFIDRDGTYWIGTYYGGVNIYNVMAKQFDHFKQNGKNSPLSYKIASAMYEDFQHTLWLSVEGDGIIHWNPQKNSYENFKHKPEDPNSLTSDNVKCIYPDGHDGLWIGTFDGLNYYSFKTRKFTRYVADKENPHTIPYDRVYDIKSDKEGNFWIATNGGGLCKYNKADKKFVTYHFSERNPNTINSDYLTCLNFDSKDRLWIGASTGLNLKYPNGRIVRFTTNPNHKQTVDGKFILFVYEDHLKRIWIGSRGSGLFLFNEKSSSFENYTTENGLPGNNIFGMLEDDHGFLWLSTENGISKYDPARNNFKNYSKSDGLICKEFNYNSYLKDHAGNMYFGGYNGIVIFNPENIRINTSVPTLVFTKLKLFNNNSNTDPKNQLSEQSISTAKSVTIKSYQNVFTIEFALLNYINSDKNQYEYKLEGFEDNWNKTSIPSATYMNLKPGKYTLLVRGCNNDGIWNDTPISITVRVLPPFWKTWWAYIFYALVLFLILLVFVRFTRVRLKLEQELFLEQLENKKQNELHQSKLRFFTNVSHEIRTPLTLIITPLDNLISNWDGDEKIKKSLLSINNNARRLLRLINQLLDFRKQESGNVQLKVSEENIVKFIDEIILSFKEYASLKKINLYFHSTNSEILAFFDKSELEKVFYNLLTNAFKFVPEKDGRVDVWIKSDPQHVIITIEDNGKGISSEHLEKIFDRFYQVENTGMEDFGFGIGLSLSKGIIELHHGTISVQSTESTETASGKTIFTVKIPLGRDHFKSSEIAKETQPIDQIESYIDLDLGENVRHASIPTPIQIDTTKYTLLIVDDNIEIRDFLAERLKGNYTILEAEDGEQAWNIAIKDVPDLIISDVVMPKLDGISFTNRLKNDERTSHIPVILLTARNELDNRLEGLETEADSFLTKPFNISILELKIRNILRSYNKLKAKYSRIVTLEPVNTEISGTEEKFLQRLMVVIERHIADTEFNVSKLVDEIGMSRPVLFRKLKALTDMSIIDLIRTTRLKKAAALLQQKKMTISEVSYAVGFTDSKYFSKAFRHQYGKTPSEYMSESEAQE
ncbi:MAG: two-component regulator propeller domain-containing protein [Bacteroidota bacterium]|nr:two-component regulator propeller domain-containing protein [Bacteroidota bacterium]